MKHFTAISIFSISFVLLFSNSMHAQSPAGVSSNLLTWWKADAGVTGSTPVTAWNDQSGNGFNLSSGSGPTLITNDINFNPSMSFNGTSQFMQVTGGLYGVSTYNDMFVFIINKTNTIQASSIFFETLNGGDRFGSHLTWSDGNVYYDHGTCCTNSRISAAWGTSTQQYHLWTLASSTSTATPSGTRKAIYRDGLSIVTNNQNDNGTGNNANFYLGSSNGTGSFHSGSIAEMIVYNGIPSSADIQAIHSYLAIKYGITVDQTTATDYLSSTGKIIYNSGSGGTHDSYDNNIAGIGRDDNSALDQQKSISINSGARVIMDKGGAFTNDEDFVVWGSDGAAVSTTTTGTHPSSTYRLQRVWRADLTGTPGAVSVSFILGSGVVNSGVATDYALLIDNVDTDFSAGAVAHTTGASLSGDTLTFTNVNFADGDYFTLGTEYKLNAPGDYSNGIVGWWKSDMGITGSSPITQWDDQSGNGFNFTAGSGPDLSSSALNYNDALVFDGSDLMSVTGGIFQTNTFSDVFTFIVNKTTTVQNSTIINESLSGGKRFGAHLPWSDNNIYYDLGTCCGASRINANWGSTTSDFNIWTLASSTGTATPSGTRKAIYRDGTSIVTNNNNDSGTGAGNNFTLGSSHRGEISEIAIYNSIPSTTELARIHTYFAIKYGITLNQDYLNTAGTTIWDATANVGYLNDIAGIGRDDNEGLNQKQSVSQNSDAMVTMALGSVAADNASNGNSFAADESYLIWGNDDDILNSVAETDLPATIVRRIPRTWLVQESGTVGTVRLQFDESNIPGPSGLGTNNLTDVRLLVDGDGVFAAGATIISPTSFDNTTNLVQFDVDFTGASGYYFSLGSVNANSASLPIELIVFDALPEDGIVKLHWVTASEINNNYFTVEKSVDGSQWEIVSTVDGSGNSTNELVYSALDSNPFQGTSYYRLKQTDFNGDFSYSGVKTVSLSDFATNHLHIYPNPSEDFARVEGSSTGLKNLKIYNIVGQDVTHKVSASVISDTQLTLDFSNLTPGNYIIKTDEISSKFVRK